MKVVELYGRVRYAVQIEGLSRREAARQFGIDPRTVAKMLAFSVPPGYRRSRPPARPKLDPFTGMIDGILAAGWRGLALFAPSRAADHGPALLAGYDRPAVQARIHCPARRDTGNASPSDEGDGRAGHRHRSQPVWWAA